LRGQAEAFGVRESGGDSIDRFDQIHRIAPHLQSLMWSLL
jgi:hypothetical protein